MAIQNRRGNYADFDANKMLPGEFAYALDTAELFYCVAPGTVRRCATKEELEQILTSAPEAYSALQELIADLESETVLTGILADISNLKTNLQTVSAAGNEVSEANRSGWSKLKNGDLLSVYSVVSPPTYICGTNHDLTGYISVGMKIKLTQTTVKYFFVTAITPTTITLYGGTDYVLANTTISNVYYSMVKTPFGFPMNPSKWSVTYELSQVYNTAIVWTNIGAVTCVVPIGLWNIEFQGNGFANTAATTVDFHVSLSTSATSETLPKLTSSFTRCVGNGFFPFRKVLLYSVTSETTLYLIKKCEVAGTHGIMPSTISIVSAYL